MAQDPELVKADPEKSWKDLVKHKNNPINYFILDLNDKSVCSQGTAQSIETVINEASSGKLIYLRIDAHEEGAYDDTVIKVKTIYNKQHTQSNQKK